jgi:hypothetical protein
MNNRIIANVIVISLIVKISCLCSFVNVKIDDLFVLEVYIGEKFKRKRQTLS